MNGSVNSADSLSEFERRLRRSRFDSDDDPEEEDIEEHIFGGPGGFFGQRHIYRSPDRQGTGGPRAAPDNADQIMRRFTELIGDIGGPAMEGPAMVGRSGPETLFPSPGQRVTLQRFSGPGYTGGVSSFTISTGSSRARPEPRRSSGAGMGPDDPFQRYGYDDLLYQFGPLLLNHDPGHLAAS